MPWNQAQREEILESYWSEGRSECPNDGAQLTFELQQMRGDYTVLVKCPGCREMVQMNRSHDPRRSNFRAWTDEEKVSMRGHYRLLGRGSCPVCGAMITPSPSDTIGSQDVGLHCPRCG